MGSMEKRIRDEVCTALKLGSKEKKQAVASGILSSPNLKAGVQPQVFMPVAQQIMQEGEQQLQVISGQNPTQNVTAMLTGRSRRQVQFADGFLTSQALTSAEEQVLKARDDARLQMNEKLLKALNESHIQNGVLMEALGKAHLQYKMLTEALQEATENSIHDAHNSHNREADLRAKLRFVQHQADLQMQMLTKVARDQRQENKTVNLSNVSHEGIIVSTPENCSQARCSIYRHGKRSIHEVVDLSCVDSEEETACKSTKT